MIKKKQGLFSQLVSLADSIYSISWKSFKVLSLTLPFIIGSFLISSLLEERESNLNKSLLDVRYNGPSHQYDETLHNPLIRIVAKDKKGNEISVCSAFVISNEYALTAGHCVINDKSKLMKEDFIVYNDKGEETTIVKAAGFIFRPDLGILRGDFSSFNQVPVAHDEINIKMVRGSFLSCGFPQGSKQIFCYPFELSYVGAFYYRGSGILIPGMSGGLVIDLPSGMIIGVNVAAEDSRINCHIASLVGFTGAFGIE